MFDTFAVNYNCFLLLFKELFYFSPIVVIVIFYAHFVQCCGSKAISKIVNQYAVAVVHVCDQIKSRLFMLKYENKSFNALF